MELSIEEFENKCMDIIEKIVSISEEQDRQEAIKVTKKMLNRAKGTGKDLMIRIYERVLHEFNIASDSEYNLLREVIFKHETN